LVLKGHGFINGMGERGLTDIECFQYALDVQRDEQFFFDDENSLAGKHGDPMM
jgi:hypothetical protein